MNHYYGKGDHTIRIQDETNPSIGLLDGAVIVDNLNFTCMFSRDNYLNPLDIYLGHAHWLVAYGSGNSHIYITFHILTAKLASFCLNLICSRTDVIFISFQIVFRIDYIHN